MSKIGTDSGVDPLLISDVLSDARQRRILFLVADNPGTLTERDLAVQLAAREERKPPSHVTASERRSRQLVLHHQKLPKLVAAGLVDQSPAGVRLVPSFPVDLTEFGVPVPSAEQTEDRRWDVIAAFVSCPYRQQIASIVADGSVPLTLDELAAQLEAHDDTDLDWHGPTADSLLVRLHHVDLPKLDELDVLSYDAAERTIRAGHSLTTVR